MSLTSRISCFFGFHNWLPPKYFLTENKIDPNFEVEVFCYKCRAKGIASCKATNLESGLNIVEYSVRKKK